MTIRNTNLSADEQYKTYLSNHIENVKKAFNWICHNTPEVFEKFNEAEFKILKHNINQHDLSKYSDTEWDAYRDYFYDNADDTIFNYAWLHHIHNNPHHWNYWVLLDSAKLVALDMPKEYIVEMICDWWSFSWKSENLYEIFTWYELHGKEMNLSSNTKRTVEDILKRIKTELEKTKNG